MAVDDTLARARADLDAGRPELARQRLRGLVGTYPARLDVREALAETYRRTGDAVQAGRYTYLSEGRDPVEVAAFESAYPDPFARMRALGWRGPEEDAPTGAARERLRALRAEAEAVAGGPVDWRHPRLPEPPRTVKDRVFEVVGMGVVASLFVLFMVGVASAVIHGIEVVAGWLD